jgi:hypothetical protein
MRRENWLKDTRKGELKAGFLDLDFKKIVAAFGAIFGSKTDAAPQMSHMNAEKNAQAEILTEGESRWLIERLNRDGGIDSNERALLDFIARECPAIHRSLAPLLHAA